MRKYDDCEISLVPERTSGLYRKGEKVSFNFSATHFGKPISGVYVEWTLSKDGVEPFKTGKGKTDSAGRLKIGTMSLDEPGFVHCYASVKTAVKKRARGIHAGAGVDVMLIKPALQPPSDFDEYWLSQKTLLANTPANIKITPLKFDEPGVNLFEVKADLPEGKKLSAVLAVPKGAKEASLPAMVTCHGAGVRSSYGPSEGANSHPVWSPARWAKKGILTIDFNALGLDNFKDRKYYLDLAKGEFKDYYTQNPNSRNTIFFRELYLRLLRAIQVVCERPEWDGKILIVGGRSQGGGQAIAAAGLSSKVTMAFAHIPAICDLGGMKASRAVGWPGKLCISKEYAGMTKSEQLKNKSLKWSESAINSARYVDAANFAKNIKCEFFMSVGFCDVVCPPTTCFAAFNNIPSKNKTMLNCVNIGHTSSAPEAKYADEQAEKAVMAHIEKMRK